MTKVAVVTGASKGIGKATAELYKAQGWRVINLSRSPCKCEGVDNLAVDLSIVGAIDQCSEALIELIGDAQQIALIHNAALQYANTAFTIKEAEMLKTFQVNVVAPTQLNRILKPHMKPGSSVIYVASTLGTMAVPGCAGYVTDKHAMVGLMRATCQDGDNTGIHTACICPGFTDTEMLRAYANDNEALLNQFADQSSFKRLIEPSEIAETVFFCSTHPVVNGAVLHANLGQINR